MVNYRTKEIYVGETGGKAEKRLKHSEYPAKDLLKKDGTEVYTRNINVDEDWQTVAKEEGFGEDSARNRIKKTAELDEFKARRKQFDGYEVINNEDKFLSEKKAKLTKSQFNVSRSGRAGVFSSQEGRLSRVKKGSGAVGLVGAALLLTDADASANEVDVLTREWVNAIENRASESDIQLINHRLASALTGQMGDPLQLSVAGQLQRVSEKAMGNKNQ